MRKKLTKRGCNVSNPITKVMKKIIVFDVDGTLTLPRQEITQPMKKALVKLSKKYNLAILAAGHCSKIYDQLNYLDNVFLVGSYGMEFGIGINKKFVFLKNSNKTIGLYQTIKLYNVFKKIRKKYNLTQYKGRSFAIHLGGVVVFALLGTEATFKEKIIFDPDKKKRELILPELKKMLPNYNIMIGGTNSFDISPKGVDKRLGIKKIINFFNSKNILYVGNDFTKNGNDYAITKTKIPYINVKNYKETIAILKKL